MSNLGINSYSEGVKDIGVMSPLKKETSKDGSIDEDVMSSTAEQDQIDEMEQELVLKYYRAQLQTFEKENLELRKNARKVTNENEDSSKRNLNGRVNSSSGISLNIGGIALSVTRKSEG